MNRNEIKAFLDHIKCFVLDLDGTVYLGPNLIEGSDKFIEKVRKRGKRIVFFTNNASKDSKIYTDKLNGLGIKATRDDIITSGDVTILYLKENYPNKRVYINGTPALEESFKESGINLVSEDPDIVIQSFDTTLTYQKLWDITNFIREGALFLATHCDINCPTETGFMPDCGAMVELITASTGKKPRYLGKPMKETVEMIAAKTGCEPSEICFIGDRIYTDVKTGVNNGSHGILVLSGESDMGTVEESDVKPTLIFQDLNEIVDYL